MFRGLKKVFSTFESLFVQQHDEEVEMSNVDSDEGFTNKRIGSGQEIQYRVYYRIPQSDNNNNNNTIDNHSERKNVESVHDASHYIHQKQSSGMTLLNHSNDFQETESVLLHQGQGRSGDHQQCNDVCLWSCPYDSLDTETVIDHLKQNENDDDQQSNYVWLVNNPCEELPASEIVFGNHEQNNNDDHHLCNDVDANHPNDLNNTESVLVHLGENNKVDVQQSKDVCLGNCLSDLQVTDNVYELHGKCSNENHQQSNCVIPVNYPNDLPQTENVLEHHEQVNESDSQQSKDVCHVKYPKDLQVADNVLKPHDQNCNGDHQQSDNVSLVNHPNDLLETDYVADHHKQNGDGQRNDVCLENHQNDLQVTDNELEHHGQISNGNHKQSDDVSFEDHPNDLLETDNVVEHHDQNGNGDDRQSDYVCLENYQNDLQVTDSVLEHHGQNCNGNHLQSDNVSLVNHPNDLLETDDVADHHKQNGNGDDGLSNDVCLENHQNDLQVTNNLLEHHGQISNGDHQQSDDVSFEGHPNDLLETDNVVEYYDQNGDDDDGHSNDVCLKNLQNDLQGIDNVLEHHGQVSYGDHQQSDYVSFVDDPNDLLETYNMVEHHEQNGNGNDQQSNDALLLINCIKNLPESENVWTNSVQNWNDDNQQSYDVKVFNYPNHLYETECVLEYHEQSNNGNNQQSDGMTSEISHIDLHVTDNVLENHGHSGCNDHDQSTDEGHGKYFIDSSKVENRLVHFEQCSTGDNQQSDGEILENCPIDLLVTDNILECSNDDQDHSNYARQMHYSNSLQDTESALEHHGPHSNENFQHSNNIWLVHSGNDLQEPEKMEVYHKKVRTGNNQGSNVLWLVSHPNDLKETENKSEHCEQDSDSENELSNDVVFVNYLNDSKDTENVLQHQEQNGNSDNQVSLDVMVANCHNDLQEAEDGWEPLENCCKGDRQQCNDVMFVADTNDLLETENGHRDLINDYDNQQSNGVRPVNYLNDLPKSENVFEHLDQNMNDDKLLCDDVDLANHPNDMQESKTMTHQEVDTDDKEEGHYTNVFKSYCNSRPSSMHPIRMPIGSYGSFYEGDGKNGLMWGLGTLISSDGTQFVFGTWEKDNLLQLHECQFVNQGTEICTTYVRKQLDHYIIIVEQDTFLAKATAKLFPAVPSTQAFIKIKSYIFDRLIVVDIINDSIHIKNDEVLEEFHIALTDVVNKLKNDPKGVTILKLFNSYINDNKPFWDILLDMQANKTIPLELRTLAKSLTSCENGLLMRELHMLKYSNNIFHKYDLKKTLYQVCTKGVEQHQETLVRNCPKSLGCLSTKLSKLPRHKALHVSLIDVQMFHHLTSVTDDPYFLTFIKGLEVDFVASLENISLETEPGPLTNQVYSFLFKSFVEIITNIVNKASTCTVENMLVFNENEWKLPESIKWSEKLKPSSNSQSAFIQTSLECQYRFIFKLLKHFKPGNVTLQRKFDYNFSKLLFKLPLESLRTFKDLDSLPEDRLVWLYLLDHTVSNILSSHLENCETSMRLLEPLFNGHINFVLTTNAHSCESFRVVTHSVLNFIALTAPYILEAKHFFEIDSLILEKQIKFVTELSETMTNDVSAYDHFEDIVKACSRYWNIRNLMLTDVSDVSNVIVTQVNDLCQQIVRLVNLSLDKAVPIKLFIGYFCALNDFLEEFKEINFYSQWYVKSQSISIHPEVLEKVNNKLVSEKECSYRVIDVRKYLEVLQDCNLPPHYILLIMEELVNCAQRCLEKNWASSGDLAVDQLEGVSLLLAAMRSSFRYFEELPNYRDFELFQNEIVGPFIRVVNNCSIIEEFRKRVSTVKYYFWYTRKADEIGVDNALDMLKNVNQETFNMDKLKQFYNMYLSDLHNFLELATSTSHQEGLDFIVNSVKTVTENCKRNIKEWDEDFRRRKLPQILAGLSAAWSLTVSKDTVLKVSSGDDPSETGSFRNLLKPHCIQILCIMRLLGIDGDGKVHNHIGQVLTGQGKSLILGLLAAVLVLTGHKVRVVCYSEYLATRDCKDFASFFELFGLAKSISYGTFDDMANEIVNPTINGEVVNVRDLLKNLFLDHKTWSTVGSSASNKSNSVLLIDEVDVFFSEELYGNTYNPWSKFMVPGLNEIQEKIWYSAKTSTRDASETLSFIKNFIAGRKASGNMDFIKFDRLRTMPGTFSLLVEHNQSLIEKKFTNQSYLDCELLKMINDAKRVVKGTEKDWYINKFKINENGEICTKYKFGVFTPSWYYDYYNVFNYFRLKVKNFNHMEFKNYGYMFIRAGNISYAKLPEEYPLILGVSGTVSSMLSHEKQAMSDSYRINHFSILPSYFGSYNLCFDEKNDFRMLITEEEWYNSVFDSASKAITAQRSVLIFFEREVELNAFKIRYQNKYDRLNVLTINTELKLKEKYIDEAGVPCTATLASREMGRGVDYKTSLSVEKKGGIHVVQTFFSVDPKEETQIKGRTARQDNCGSYELVVCKPHLAREGLLPLCPLIDYETLDTARLKIMNDKGKKIARRILQSDSKHKKTMEFFALSTK